MEAVLTAIRASGEDQVREIETAAQAEVQNATAQNQAENQRLRQEAKGAAEALGAAERARTLSQARLEAQRVIHDVRDELRGFFSTRGGEATGFRFCSSTCRDADSDSNISWVDSDTFDKDLSLVNICFPEKTPD